MSRVSKEPEERREEIIAAAKKLFDEKGYENTMMSDVAQTVGISQGLPYRYFKSKRELLHAVAEDYAKEYARSLLSISFAPGMSAKNKLDVYFKHMADNATRSKLIPVLHQKDNVELHNRIAESFMRGIVLKFRDLIIEGNAQGCFDCPFPDECAIFLLNGVTGVQEATPINYMEGVEAIHEGLNYILTMFYRVLGVKEE